MGWDGYIIAKGQEPFAVIKKEYDSIFKRSVASSSSNFTTEGAEYFAVKKEDCSVFAVVLVWKIDKETLWVKELWEQEGPVAAYPSKEVLEVLTPIDHKYANDWRRLC